jgi:hypothetical protein
MLTRTALPRLTGRLAVIAQALVASTPPRTFETPDVYKCALDFLRAFSLGAGTERATPIERSALTTQLATQPA